MDPIIITALTIASRSELIKNIYEDLFSKSVKKMGVALETVVDFSNTMLDTLKFHNEKRDLIRAYNLRIVQKELEVISETELMPADPEVAHQIWDRLGYVVHEDLRKAFIKLLKTASSSATCQKAHPGFIHVIDRLAADDAKILEYFYLMNFYIPRVNFKVEGNNGSTKETFHVTDGTDKVSREPLIFPNNKALYFDNLISLGLVTWSSYTVPNEEQYKSIEQQLLVAFNAWKQKLSNQESYSFQILSEHHSFTLTSFGKLFLEACML